jgi:hypothetical protein
MVLSPRTVGPCACGCSPALGPRGCSWGRYGSGCGLSRTRHPTRHCRWLAWPRSRRPGSGIVRLAGAAAKNVAPATTRPDALRGRRHARPTQPRVRASCHALFAWGVMPIRRSLSWMTVGPVPLLRIRRPVETEKPFNPHHSPKLRTRWSSSIRSRKLCRHCRRRRSSCRFMTSPFLGLALKSKRTASQCWLSVARCGDGCFGTDALTLVRLLLWATDVLQRRISNRKSLRLNSPGIFASPGACKRFCRFMHSCGRP